MGGPRDFRRLQIWQRAHELTLAIYTETTSFPKHEIYGLTGQMRRAAASAPCNIAEGCGRGGEAELARFLNIARGSASELAYQCILARDLKYLEHTVGERLETHADELSRMITAYSARLIEGNG